MEHLAAELSSKMQDAPAKQTPLAWLAELCLKLSAAALVALAAVQVWQVFARYVLNHTPAWTEAVSSLLLIALLSLAAAAGVYHQNHFSFDLLQKRLAPRWRAALQLLLQLVITALCAILGWNAFKLYVDGTVVKQAGVAFSQGSFYLPFALSCALMCVFALHHARLAVVALRRGQAESNQDQHP